MIDRGLHLLALSAALCFALAAPPAFAACPDDESGLGGTGHADDESGLGGTGHGGDDESGMGGTGVGGDQDSGMGGTGIVGLVTGMGSVCVNGLRVEYDDDTPVEVNGREAKASELEVGQVVVLDAQGSEGKLRALQIRVRNAIEGPLTGVEASAGRIEVMGQPVEVAPNARVRDRITGGSTELGDLVPGQFVSVAGERDASGTIVATRVARRAPLQEASVSGRIQRDADGGARVGRLRLEGAPADRGGTGASLVRGRFDARKATLRAARVEPSVRFGRDTQRVSLEGYVQELDAERAVIGGLALDLSRLDKAGKLTRDRRVRVRARRERDGRLRATRIREERDLREGFRSTRSGGESDDDSDRSRYRDDEDSDEDSDRERDRDDEDSDRSDSDRERDDEDSDRGDSDRERDDEDSDRGDSDRERDDGDSDRGSRDRDDRDRDNDDSSRGGSRDVDDRDRDDRDRDNDDDSDRSGSDRDDRDDRDDSDDDDD